MARWSSAIAQRYALELSPPWIEWFDRIAPEATCDGEFCEPVHPETLLDAAPEVIWPGLMPPDLLPLVGNAIGDWLCGRVAADNTIAEVVYWYHGGGDCLPYGQTMAEALVYDSLAPRFPGRERALAIPAQAPPVAGAGALASRPCIRWALQHLPAEVAEVYADDFPVAQTGEHLLRAGVSEDAIRCDLVLAALDNEVRRRMTPQLAAKLEARWEQEVVRWMFDPDSMPAACAQRLAQHWDLPAEQWRRQDWGVAAEHCRQVAQRRGDLAWVHDILGWAAQRSGDRATAIAHYTHGATVSQFTDQAVRFRSHFDNDRYTKFAVARLAELDASGRLDPGYVAALSAGDAAVNHEASSWRDQVCRYWRGQAERVAGQGGPEAGWSRYELLHLAGWDVGCDSLGCYKRLLVDLAAAAEAAGQPARAAVARAHHQCLRARYLLD